MWCYYITVSYCCTDTYSARLYTDSPVPGGPSSRAVFCIVPYQPLYTAVRHCVMIYKSIMCVPDASFTDYFIHSCTHSCTRILSRTHIHTHAHTHACTRTHKHTRTHARAHTHAHTHTHSLYTCSTWMHTWRRWSQG